MAKRKSSTGTKRPKKTPVVRCAMAPESNDETKAAMTAIDLVFAHHEYPKLIATALQASGYDGLVSSTEDCFCTVQNPGVLPGCQNCTPGYAVRDVNGEVIGISRDKVEIPQLTLSVGNGTLTASWTHNGVTRGTTELLSLGY